VRFHTALRHIQTRYGYLDTTPGCKVARILADHAIRLLTYPLRDQTSGYLWYWQDRWLILVNANHPPTRQLFSTAHELKHYFCDRRRHGDFYWCATTAHTPWLERQANKFAAELLMPPLMMQDLVRKHGLDCEAIARRLGLSIEAVFYRLRVLGLHTPEMEMLYDTEVPF